jgi:hypothetical protein
MTSNFNKRNKLTAQYRTLRERFLRCPTDTDIDNIACEKDDRSDIGVWEQHFHRIGGFAKDISYSKVHLVPILVSGVSERVNAALGRTYIGHRYVPVRSDTAA